MRQWILYLLLMASVHAAWAQDKTEDKVKWEIAKAREIIGNPSRERVLESPYLVTALYYRTEFLAKFPDNGKNGDSTRRIIAAIKRSLTPSFRNWYMFTLKGMCASAKPVKKPYPPVKHPRYDRGPQHPYALDIFSPEGSPVYSLADGLVVLAEGGWIKDDIFSTASPRGGNEVIVFNPSRNRFIRFAHLDKVLVHAGETVSAGQQVGTIGHTGTNACKEGHGNHVHLEINEYDQHRQIVLAQSRRQLSRLLR